MNKALSQGAARLALLFLVGIGPLRAHETHETGATSDPSLENKLHPAHTDNANIRVRSHLDPFSGNNRYGDVWGEGNIALLGSFADESVGVIDISDPDAPKLLSTYRGSAPGLFEDMQMKNGIAYIGSYHPDTNAASGLHIVDLTAPENPALIKRLSVAEKCFKSIHNLFLDGTTLYLADSATPVVKVFDVADPAAPVFIRDIRTSDTQFIHDMTVISNRLYTSGWSGATDIYDVTDIAAKAPTRLGIIRTGAASHSSWVNDTGTILVSCSEYQARDLRVYSITNPASPVLLSTITSRTLGLEAATPHNPVIVGDLLFVSWYQAGLQVFNLRDPAKPLLVGAYDTFPGGLNVPGGLTSDGVTWDGCWGVYPLLGLERVLLSDLDGGLYVVDASKLGGPDADGDRIPDRWEIEHALSPEDPNDGLLDDDGDGMSNLHEFISGTHPQSGEDVVRLQKVKREGRDTMVSFGARAGRLYRLERNLRLAATGWTLVKDEIEGVNGLLTVTQTNTANAMQFYRVLARP